jgi:adenylate cyclase
VASPAAGFTKVFAELKRRRVFGAVAAYVVLAALLIELSGAIFEALLLPDWSARLFTILLILGLPVVAVMSWFFDLRPGGIARTPESEAPGRTTEAGLGLEAALKASRGVPVPDGPVRRRQLRPVADAGGDGPMPDPERVRAAAMGHMRHELRTPINGIIGYSEMLLEDVDEDALAADLSRIREAGRRLLDRVDEVLRPDRLRGDSPEDIEAFAEQVRVDLRTPINAVVGYAELVMETCQEEGRDALLPDLERILSSARRLLDLSEDIVGVGTRDPEARAPDGLTESSQLTRQVLARIQPVRAAGDRPDGEGRLLVVDDNETNRDLLSRQLARHGYVVSSATDGKEGLERLEREDYDLILLDVIMPGMNGVEMLGRIQADPRWAEIPVIMLSSLDEVDSAVRCIEMGALDYVAKPVQATLLEARIAAALEIRELRRREDIYRRRVEADTVLIGRLLDGAVPGPLRRRVADGTLDIVESYPEITAVRGVVSGSRPGGDGTGGVRGMAAAVARFEALARARDVDICLWRPDGFLAATTGDGHAGRAADLVVAARKAFGEPAPGFGLHTAEAVGGILGRDRPRFELWGEAVDTAEALAGLARAGEALLTSTTEGELRESHALEARGVRDVAGTQIRIHALVPDSPDRPAREAVGS